MRMVKLQNSWDCTITCYDCGTKQTWNKAVMLAWSADLDGEPYKAYYCPTCTQKRLAAAPTPPAA